MAKAKKPASTSKGSSQAPKAADDKETQSATKPTETSSASKAAASKADKTVSATPTATGTRKKAQAKTAEASEAKASTDATSSTPAKPTSTPSTSTTTAKPAESKASSAPSETAKAEAAKTSPQNAQPEKKAETATTAASKEPEKKPATPPGSASAPVSAASKPAEKSGSVFWPLVLGGVIAAALGFVASEMNVLNTRVDTTEMKSTLDQQAEQIAALEASKPVAAPDLSGIEAQIAALDETVMEFETRLAELENRPVAQSDGTAAPAADYSQELAALQSSVEAQKAEIDRLLENALSVEEATAEAARRAAVQNALTKITAALNTGGGYDPALADLSQAGVQDVPEALAVPADSGVATLLSLQTEFPNNARAALSAARAAGVDEGDGGAVGFLRRQLGARSVEPREGSDPDAVLSRAEAAVREGRLTDALTEIETLPPEAQAAMESWLSDARARVEAEAAVQDLSQRLTAN